MLAEQCRSVLLSIARIAPTESMVETVIGTRLSAFSSTGLRGSITPASSPDLPCRCSPRMQTPSRGTALAIEQVYTDITQAVMLPHLVGDSSMLKSQDTQIPDVVWEQLMAEWQEIHDRKQTEHRFHQRMHQRSQIGLPVQYERLFLTSLRKQAEKHHDDPRRHEPSRRRGLSHQRR
jgi:hypothetical protein